MAGRIGWVAEFDEFERAPHQWSTYIQTESNAITLEIHFDSKEACEKFIRDELIPAGGRFYEAPA